MTESTFREPQLIKGILTPEDYGILLRSFKNNNLLKKIDFDNFGRKTLNESAKNILTEYSLKLLPIIQSFYENEEILPSYSLFVEYSDKNISLFKHKDQAACTYTLDLCLYQSDPWPIYVENKEYILYPNDALLFMGEDQEHWRPEIINNEDKKGFIFFHYVLPNHWWYTNPEWRHE
jgi:hypothetical protein